MGSKRYFDNQMKDFQSGLDEEQASEEFKHHPVGLLMDCMKHLPPSTKNADGGIYVGYTGIAYAMVHVAKNSTFGGEKVELLQNARRMIDVALSDILRQSHRSDLAFILGDSGVLVTAAIIYNTLGDQQRALELASEFIKRAGSPKNYKYDELFVGRAGFLCGAKMLMKMFGPQIVSDGVIFAMCDAIVESGRHYSKRVHSKSPLMYQYYNTEYLGAAHGLASILLMLLQFPNYLSARPEAASAVRASVDFMISSTPISTGNLPPDCGELKEGARVRDASNDLVHWCHGAPGVVYTYARAYLIWKDQRYLEECKKCSQVVWERGLIKKGPGICHGVAGNAYVHLLLHRLTGSAVYLHRAKQFARFLLTPEFQREARTPDGPHTLFEGWAGTACFLADLSSPSCSHFPLFNVFD